MDGADENLDLGVGNSSRHTECASRRVALTASVQHGVF